jgi:hypothetical protein
MSRALVLVLVVVCAMTEAPARATEGVRPVESAVLEAGTMRARIDHEGAHFSIGGAMRTSAIGRSQMHALALGATSIVEATVHTDRGLVDEWWRAVPSGLEHGLTISERPPGDGELRIAIALDGLTAHARSGDAIELVAADGSIATYSHLVVLDADGAVVHARLTANASSIAITIDDATARYPLIVDPILAAAQEAELMASDTATNAELGGSVALDATGTRAVVGAQDHASNTGAVYVFVRTGTSWAQEALLTASDAATGNSFGCAVAIDATGTRIVVGAYGRSSLTGAAYVFVRTGTSWAQEAELTARGGDTFDRFGSSVAIDAMGIRALVGAEGRSAETGFGNTGAAYVFVRTATSWAQESELTASDAAGNASFGHAVAIDSTGARGIFGAPGHASGAGAAYVFSRVGSNWTQDAELVAPDGAANDSFGASVAIGATRALVGAPLHASNTGAAYAFAEMATSWTLEAEVTASDGAANDRFGDAVALDATGARGLVGAGGASTAGAAYVIMRAGTSWTQQLELTASDRIANDDFGSAVALDSMGMRALVGANLRASLTGAAYVFTVHPDEDGVPCTSGASCVSGHCVEGVCCDSACGGGFGGTSCSSCLATNTGGVDGTCAPLSASIAPTVTCRAAIDAHCDVAEVCSGASTSCPTDAFAPAGTVCHAAPTCFAQCSGASGACPTTPVAAATVCRASAGACDLAESCDGTSTSCPADGLASTATVCRASTASCDPAEHCDGTSTTCPTDVTMCTADSGARDAGTDAGVDAASAIDASRTTDASVPNVDAATTPPPVAGSCGCRAGSSRAGTGLWLLLALALLRRRR